MSPALVPASTPGGVVRASTSDERGRLAMRMSPKRASPCTAPEAPSAAPSSETRLKSMLVAADQVCKARRISPCHTDGDSPWRAIFW